MTRLALALAVIALPSPIWAQSTDRAAKRAAAQEKYHLAVDASGSGGANESALFAVYNSAWSEIAVHFGESELGLEPIRIHYREKGPIVHYARNLRGEIVVELNAKGRHWAQHAYQAAHEFCHILCRFKKADRSNLWFEESLCELASIYSLRQMTISWEENAPYPSWKEFSPELKSYSDDVIADYSLTGATDFLSWFKKTESELREVPTQRDKNGRVALQLLPLFEDNPSGWQALPFINIGVENEAQSFDDYLKAWHSNTPSPHQAFVAKIAAAFGVAL